MTADVVTPPAAPRAARTPRPRPGPHLRHERVLLRDGARLVAGMDEVGRGSLAGPVSVGVVVVDVTTRSAPRGVADSKLLTPAARTALLPALRRWGLARAVGHASAEEIDAVGIIAALRLAGTRALDSVHEHVGPVDVVLLDGSHDWLSGPTHQDLFASVEPEARPAPRVLTRVKADRSCATVAAASVLAKCERDAMMVDLAARHPEYRWDDNKGYSSPDHLVALRELGPCVLHRRSWRLPLTGGPVATGDVEGLDPLLGLDALGLGAVPGPVVTSRD
ncbi:ribonuclease HII [Cellulomonas biazotea]|uniref:Ribonuclease n=1 Tax=Cellulomonas biazotea TaxID=1709 RepID=A0A402DLT4_9CELL|nr:ribonuclease HII [Cellulomonas biazotea]GCE75080.1 ribonuclease HII [Cellulomonas biazotea]